MVAIRCPVIAWLWRRVSAFKIPLIICGLLLIVLGGVRIGVRVGWFVGVALMDSAPGPAAHWDGGRRAPAPLVLSGVRGVGRVVPGSSTSGFGRTGLSVPNQQEILHVKMTQPFLYIKRRKCSSSKEFPFKPWCSPLLRGPGVKDFSTIELKSNTEVNAPAPFPWPRRENFTPNFFLNCKNKKRVELRSPNRTLEDRESIIVFLHHNKAAGTTAKECLKQAAKATNRELGHVLSNDGRVNLMLNLRKLRRRGKRIPDTFFGGYAFGVCDELEKPCSYFTVLRDPYRRTLSSYSYCKAARGDQLCSALDAEKVTLREWALHQGSFFFRQLLFHPEFCSDKTKWIPFVDLKKEPHDFEGSQESLGDVTCWFRQKLIMSLTLDQTEHNSLLQYCVDNLEKWFKVILLVDEFDLSLAMLEHAYHLPFHELCSGRHVNAGTYANRRKAATSSQSNVTNSTSRDSLDIQIQNLRDDPDVRNALHADLVLYQRGLEIFEKQKTCYKEIEGQI